MRSEYSRDSGSGLARHSQEERLERLAGAVDADVGRRRGRQDAADRIERLGPGGGAVDELAVILTPLDRRSHVLGDEIDAAAVRIEDPVEIADVPGAEWTGEHRRITVVAVPPPEPGVVGDVAGALLEVTHQPTPLEDLGEQIRCLFARQVYPTELGDRVVAVVEEHPLVQLLGAVEADRGIDRMVTAHVEIADELVEEQAAERLVAAAVSSEQRALDDFGQVDQCEHGTVEIGEVSTQHVGFVLAEGLGDVHSHEELL